MRWKLWILPIIKQNRRLCMDSLRKNGSFWKINTASLILKTSLPHLLGTPWIGQIWCPPKARSMQKKPVDFISKMDSPVYFEQIGFWNWILCYVTTIHFAKVHKSAGRRVFRFFYWDESVSNRSPREFYWHIYIYTNILYSEICLFMVSSRNTSVTFMIYFGVVPLCL